MASHSSQALPLSRVPMRERSISSQYESPSIEKPTHSPSSPLTRRATTVPRPRRATISPLIRRSSTVWLNSSKRSPGSRGAMRTFSCSASVLISDTRAMASEWISAARDRLTIEAIWRALSITRGSYSSARNIWYQPSVVPSSSSASRKKVRQNRLKPNGARCCSSSGSSGALLESAS